MFDQLLEKFQETSTVALVGLAVCSLISVKNILYGLSVYLCNQIVRHITQMIMRFFPAQKSVIFYILDIKVTQTMQPHFFITLLKHSGYYKVVRNF
jgi:hypothetical protein